MARTQAGSRRLRPRNGRWRRVITLNHALVIGFHFLKPLLVERLRTPQANGAINHLVFGHVVVIEVVTHLLWVLVEV